MTRRSRTVCCHDAWSRPRPGGWDVRTVRCSAVITSGTSITAIPSGAGAWSCRRGLDGSGEDDGEEEEDGGFIDILVCYRYLCEPYVWKTFFACHGRDDHPGISRPNIYRDTTCVSWDMTDNNRSLDCHRPSEIILRCMAVFRVELIGVDCKCIPNLLFRRQ